MSIVINPSPVNVMEAPGDLQMEITYLKIKFDQVSPRILPKVHNQRKIYRSKNVSYDSLEACEQIFSRMKYSK